MADAVWLRVIHVAGAVLLLGNVTVTGFWAAYLYRARGTVPFRPVARAILWTDVVFTLGGGAMLVVSGVLLVRAGGYAIADTPWLRQGIGALASSTALWLVFLLPPSGGSSCAGAWWGGRPPRSCSTVFGRWSPGPDAHVTPWRRCHPAPPARRCPRCPRSRCRP